jgi:hypothetical protein
MLSWLEREPDPIIEPAIAEFSASNSNDVVRSFCSVCEEVDGGFVVRICYDHLMPPKRAWFLVSCDASDARQLSEAESEPYRKGPWR